MREVSQKEDRHGKEEKRVRIVTAEAMRHHAGLSNGFWIYAVKAKLHAYNVTPIKRLDYKTPVDLWSDKKPDISHL